MRETAAFKWIAFTFEKKTIITWCSIQWRVEYLEVLTPTSSESWPFPKSVASGNALSGFAPSKVTFCLLDKISYTWPKFGLPVSKMLGHILLRMFLVPIPLHVIHFLSSYYLYLSTYKQSCDEKIFKYRQQHLCVIATSVGWPNISDFAYTYAAGPYLRIIWHTNNAIIMQSEWTSERQRNRQRKRVRNDFVGVSTASIWANE